jgi:long-subunit fatty acid transport protein
VPSDDDYYSDNSDNGYYNALNHTVKSYYRNSFNFRLGGELKFSELAVRAGGSYSTSPYSDPSIKSHRATVGGGLGYRQHGIFVDLTYVESFVRDASFPYRLGDKDNIYADVKQHTGNIILTVGLKF